jgi:hydroxyacylglutathione hydrolase
MIFFWAETPDGWGIPGIHGPFAEDETLRSRYQR